MVAKSTTKITFIVYNVIVCSVIEFIKSELIKYSNVIWSSASKL